MKYESPKMNVYMFEEMDVVVASGIPGTSKPIGFDPVIAESSEEIIEIEF